MNPLHYTEHYPFLKGYKSWKYQQIFFWKKKTKNCKLFLKNKAVENWDKYNIFTVCFPWYLKKKAFYEKVWKPELF